MEYTCYNMNAYNLHIIKTDTFKTITVGIGFRRKVKKEEITIRNLLKLLMINASYNYPTEKSLIIETEKLYDLKMLSSSYRVGNYTILDFKIRFLNERYTEKGMNEESIKFMLDVIFNPKLDIDLDKCKKKIEKSIISCKDNKIRFALQSLLETTDDKAYSYNNNGYLDDLNKITYEDIQKYYNSIIENDIVDVFVVGDVDDNKIKEIVKENLKVYTFHKKENDFVISELPKVRKIREFNEKDDVNQTQLTMLCSLNDITDYERRYVLAVYGELLGGNANSLLFDTVREKNSYAYYVNAVVNPYDNIMMIYSGVQQGNEKAVKKLVNKTLKDITKGTFDKEKLENAKKTLISSIRANYDNPMGIISQYYAKVLFDGPEIEEKIAIIEKVSYQDIINVSKKINVNRVFLLEATNEKDNN